MPESTECAECIECPEVTLDTELAGTGIPIWFGLVLAFLVGMVVG